MKLRSIRDLLDEEFIGRDPNGEYLPMMSDNIEIFHPTGREVNEFLINSIGQLIFNVLVDGCLVDWNCDIDDKLFEVYKVTREQL